MPAKDLFPNRHYDRNEPFTRAFTIAPNDTDELPYVTRGIMVNGAGTILVIMAEDDPNGAPIEINLQAGVVYYLRIRKIFAQYSYDGGVTFVNTTATGIIGLL